MKLSDTQLLLLSKATQQDGLVLVPPNLKSAVAARVLKPLLEQGLIQEVPSTPDMPGWRRDEAEGQSYALLITSEGRAAINTDDPGERIDRPEPPEPAAKPRASAMPAAKAAAKKKSARKGTSDGSPRPGSKLAKVIGMLSSKAGTTIDAIVKVTDWLPHTTRAALTGLRKRGYEIEKKPREGGRTIYRIVGGAGSPKTKKAPVKKPKARKA
jgi:hypothetical protein